VHTAIALLKLGPLQRARPVGIVFYHRGLKHLAEGNAHAFGDGRNVLKHRHAF
jgi:hypothetical protein